MAQDEPFLKQIPPNPPLANKLIRGEVRMDYAFVVKKLGRQTTKVWTALIWRRDDKGQSFATVKHISQETKIPVKTVEFAFSRLRKLGILKNGKWERRDHRTKKYSRYVYGDHRSWFFWTTKETKKAIEKMSNWGGKRAKKKAKQYSSKYPKA